MDALEPWRQELASYGDRIFGSSRVYLQQKECSAGECNLGNFYTDAMLHAFLGEQIYESPNWSNVTIALTTQGNFRVPLQPGNLTYNHLITMCPWENDLYVLTLNGSVIRDLLEDAVAPFTLTKKSSSRFLQVSGLRIVYNITQSVGQRVQSLKVRCANCNIPKYEEIDEESDYGVVVMEYLANGKNGFSLIKDNAKDLRRGPGDLDALIKFMQINEPIVAGIEAADVVEEMQPWKSILDEQIAQIIGESKVDLEKSDCDRKECNIGNFFADATVYAFTKLTAYNELYWSQAAIALINTGAIRVPLYKGNLSYGHLSTMSPFENKMAAFTLPGARLVEALEFSLNEIDVAANKLTSSIFLQVSGLKVTYNFTRPYGQRVQTIKVLCQNCNVPKYLPLQMDELYRIVTSDFIAEGGGGFTMFRDYGENLQKEMTDLEAICDYVNDNTPITSGLDGRIIVTF